MASTELESSNAPAHPIHRLPNELLLEIFKLYGVFMNWDVSYLLYTPTTTVETGHGNYWAPLMLVCRFWRELALATPSLWQEIDVSQQTRWMELALLRSQNAPLALVFHPGAARVGVPLVLPHAHRIRRLILRRPFTQRKVEFPAYLPLLRTPMASLHELVLSDEESEYHDQARPGRGYAVLPLSDKHFPGLRILRLPSTAIPWTPNTVSRLRCLVLHDCTAQGVPLPGDRFLDVLQCCQKLEELQLLDGFITSAIDIQALGGSPGAVTLPRLRKFVLGDQPTITSWLLSCLQLPRCTSMRIIGAQPDEGAITPEGVFAPYVPRDAVGRLVVPMPLRPTCGGVFTTSECKDFQVKVLSEDATLVLQLTAYIPWYASVWEDQVDRAVVEFCTLLAGTPLMSITVDYGRINVDSEKKTLSQLVSSFPSAGSLEVRSKSGRVTKRAAPR